jgi:antitoxin component YwqK of YwqJK toxin-antitoxin module
MKEIKTKFEHYFIDNKNQKQGEYKKYFLDGKINVLCYYTDNRLNGPYSSYYFNDQIKTECNYKNNKIDGNYLLYDLKGDLIENILFINGRMVK